MKKTRIFAVITCIALVLCLALSLSGCKKDQDTGVENKFIGEYTSTYQDVQTTNRNGRFLLIVKENGSFKLVKVVGEEIEFEKTGSYKLSADGNELVCTMGNEAQTLHNYFTLSFMADGSLMAKPQTWYAAGATKSAFGVGDLGFPITLVYFAKA